MEKETGEENPFFYSAVSNYMKANTSKGISDWIDSKGNVNITQINNIAKIAQKEFIRQKQQTEEQQQKNMQQQEKIDEQAQILETLASIDFNNLTLNDLKNISEHFEEFALNSSEEDFNLLMEKSGKSLGIDEQVLELQKLWKKMQNPDYLQTEEDKGLFDSISPELCDEIGIDKTKYTFDNEKMMEMMAYEIKVLRQIIELSRDEQDINEEILEAVFSKDRELYDKYGKIFDKKILLEKIENGEIEQYIADREENLKDNQETPQIEDKLNNIWFNAKDLADSEIDFEAEFADGLAEFDALETQAVEAESIEPTEQQTEDFGMDFTDEFADALADFDLEEQNALAVGEDMQQMQEVAELAMDNQMSKAVDYAEISKEETIVEFEGDKEVFAQEEHPVQEEIPMQPELTQDIAQEKVQAEQELKDYEMEVEEKNGLAGLFSKVKDFIQNIPAIQGLFAKTNKQERLGDGKPQVTREDGIKQTTYFGNGSLEPWTVRARNFAINLGSNVMEAIGKVAKSSNKEDKDVSINRPTIIKSQEKTNERTTEEQQIDNIELNPMQQQQMDSLKAVEQQGRKMDDNPWAINVDKNMEKEALARSANAGKSQSIDKSSSHDKPNHDDDGTIGLG